MATTTTPTPTDFADALGKLRRSIRRAVRVDLAGPPLPASETELLALIHRSAGIGVAEAAEALGVAPNTVSTLVGRLQRAGLLRRLPDPADRRAAQLHLTRAGLARMTEVRRRRTLILDDTFAALQPADQETLLGSLPALERLIAALATVAPDVTR